MNIYGTSGDDTLVGATGNVDDYIEGGAGNDLLLGVFGDDWLVGGTGNDTLNGGSYREFGNTADYRTGTFNLQVDLQAGWALDGLGGTDTLQRIENIAAGSGNDTLDGSTFNNWFYPGGGTDRVNGRGGMDGVIYDTAGAGLVVNLWEGRASGGGIGTDFLISIENVTGSPNGDTLVLSDTQGGSAMGKAGNDVIMGGASSDFLRGGSGNDTMDGSTGDDSVFYDGDAADGGPEPTNSGVVIDLAAGYAVDNWGHIDSLVNIERATGSAFDDVITGNSAWNHLNGGAGNDTLRGGAGDDVLSGDAGIDKAVFQGAMSQYDFGVDPSGLMTYSNILGEGFDVIMGVERLVFSDVSLAIDLYGNAGFVASVFSTVFGDWALSIPTAVAVGLAYTDSGDYSEAQLMQMAIDARLGSGASLVTVVNTLFTNVYGHAPTTAERDHYVSLVASGDLTRGELGLLFAEVLGVPEAAGGGLVYTD
ncbi:MAG: hypothetical protein HY854_04280 [Burkholderiales bacterium]|nr:hypothetical protein [Burkholderiales bacterium]